jgi:hypothetical protein
MIYFVSRKFRKMPNLVKCIEKYLLVGKMQMTYQNDPKNVIYIFVSESYMFIQLRILFIIEEQRHNFLES